MQKSGRIYKIGPKLCEIPWDVIDNFQKWNTSAPEMYSEEIDRKLVSALLLVLLSKGELANSDIDIDTLNFIKGKLG